MTAEKLADKKDEEIIRLLRDDAWLTHAQIGERIHLSASAVQRRIERLRAAGAITGAKATIDPAVLQGRSRVYLLLELHRDGKSALDALVGSLKGHADISGIDLLAGGYDILITVDCVDIEAFFEFAMTALNENENVRHCSTLTRLKQLH
ncbi:MAG: Lrp/AsnC family transcriptional regulator [Parvularculaceae bacterium]